MAFNPLPEDLYDKYDADHIDNNPFNDTLDNLQWLTKKENLNKSILTNNNIGEYNNNAKLTDSIVKEISENIIMGYTDLEISKKLNVSCDLIQRIKHKDCWVHITNDYDFDKFINKRKPYTYYDKSLKDSIRELLVEDINMKPKDICNLLSIEHNTKTLNLICTIKRKIKLEKSGSTTSRKTYTQVSGNEEHPYLVIG